MKLLTLTCLVCMLAGYSHAANLINHNPWIDGSGTNGVVDELTLSASSGSEEDAVYSVDPTLTVYKTIILEASPDGSLPSTISVSLGYSVTGDGAGYVNLTGSATRTISVADLKDGGVSEKFTFELSYDDGVTPTETQDFTFSIVMECSPPEGESLSSVSSVHSIGKGSGGASGFVRLYSENINPEVYFPHSLQYGFDEDQYELITDSNVSKGGFVVSEFLQSPRLSAQAAPTVKLGTPALSGGIYTIWARVYAPSTEQNTVWYSLDGESDFVLRSSQIGTWSWVKVEADAEFSAGVGSIQIKQRDQGLGLDAVLVTDDTAFVPSGSEPNLPATGEAYLIEAESGEFDPVFLDQPTDSENYAGMLSHTVDGVLVGDYDFWMRVRSIEEARVVIFWNDSAEGTEVVIPATSDWEWIRVSNYASVVADANYNLKVRLPDSAIEIDAFVLTDDSDIVLSGTTQSTAIGTYWLEAEDFTTSMEIGTVDGISETSNGAYVTKNQFLSDQKALVFRASLLPNRTVDSSGQLSLPLDFEENGQHYLWARVRVPYTGRDSVWVSVAGNSEADGYYREDVPWVFDVSGNDWEWVRFEDVALNYAREGERQISLRFREGGVHLDRVIVTTDSEFIPDSMDAIPTGSFTAYDPELISVFKPFTARSAVRQIRGVDTLVDFEDLDSSAQGYSIKRYLVSSEDTPSSSGLYDIAALGEPYSSATIRNPDPYDHDAGTGSYDQLEVSRGGANVSLYVYDEVLGDWSLTTGGGLRREERKEYLSPDGLTRTVLNSIYGSDDELVDQSVEVFQRYAFGEKRIELIRDSEGLNLDAVGNVTALSGSPLVNTWSYYSENGPEAGKLHYSTTAEGGWAIYEYDDEGRLSKEIHQFKDSEFDDESNSRVVSFSYTNPGVTESGDVLFTQRVEELQGIEISRSFEIDVRDPDTRARLLQRRIQATEPEATWDAASNLVTSTYYIPDGVDFSGQVLRVERPDGTGAIYSYALADETFVFVSSSEPVSVNCFIKTEKDGALDENNVVVDGYETIIHSSVDRGEVLKRTKKDIVSGLTVDEMTALDLDEFGRAIIIGYGDGSVSTRTYAGVDCGCGPDKLKLQVDRQGVETSYEYNALGDLIATTRLGVTGRRGVDANGRVIRDTRESGEYVQVIREIDYNMMGQVVEQRNAGAVLDGSFVPTRFDYEYPVSGGLVVTTTYADGGTQIRKTYPDGLLLSTLGTAVLPIRLDYGVFDEAGNKGTFTREYSLMSDPELDGAYLEAEWVETRNVMGRKVATLYPDGALESIAYSHSGRVAEKVDADGVTTRTIFDSRGRQKVNALKLTDSVGIDFSKDRVTEYEYSVIERNADFGEGPQAYVFEQTKVYAYPNVDDSITRVLLQTSEREVSGRGNLSTNVAGVVAKNYRTTAVGGSWDDVSVAASGVTSIASYIGGQLVATRLLSASGDLQHEMSYQYDHYNRRKNSTDSRTGTTELTYYDNDALASTIGPDPDGAGQLGTLLTQFIYDNMGRQTQIIHPDATSTYTVYNQKGQVEKTYGSQQNPVEYTYDYAGRQKTMTTWQDFDESTRTGLSGSATTTWTYDSQRGWLTRKEYDDAEGTDYTYTPGGRLASRTWARGVVTNYAYNNAGDLLAVDYLDSGATPDVLYSYTRTGQQDEVKDGQFAASEFSEGAILSSIPPLVTTGYTYDYDYNDRFQIDTETVVGLLTNDAVLTRTYEDGTETIGLIGRVSGHSLSTDGGQTSVAAATYTYDNAGRLKTVSDPANGGNTFTYGYLANTRNLLETVTGPVHTTTYSYESGRNTMTGVENEETVGTNSVVSNYTYTYNELGQRADREQSGTAFSSTNKDTFTYDYLGQVTASANDTLTGNAHNPTYAYDEIGNRSGNIVDTNGTTGYTQDLLNQYTAVGANSPVYDDDGNLTSDGIWTYTWNGENRLVSATNGTTTIDFTYDYQGRLIEKDDGTDVEVYLYDGWNRIATFRPQVSALTPHKTYLWGMDLSGSMQGAGGVGGLLKEGNLYLTYDANGNIVQKLNSSGVASMAVEYDPFGNIISGSLTGEYGFSTKPLIGSIEMYYYGFRYYDPVTGRWPSRDPIGEKAFFDKMVKSKHVFDGLNLETAGLHPNYAFLLNDPINDLDVLGLDRYVTQFDICNLGGSGGTQLHVGAAVDWWKEVNGKWVKGGTVTYDFSVDWEKEDGSGDLDWWNILKGAFWTGRGRIVKSQGLTLDSPVTMPSSPCQDKKMKTLVEADIANPPRYNSLTINCLGWAVGAVNYGMDEPEPGKCCNPDGSIWTAP